MVAVDTRNMMVEFSSPDPIPLGRTWLWAPIPCSRIRPKLPVSEHHRIPAINPKSSSSSPTAQSPLYYLTFHPLLSHAIFTGDFAGLSRLPLSSRDFLLDFVVSHDPPKTHRPPYQSLSTIILNHHHERDRFAQQTSSVLKTCWRKRIACEATGH